MKFLLLALLFSTDLMAGAAQKHVDLANRYLRKGRLKDARLEAEVARRLEPQHPAVLTLWQRLEGGTEVAAEPVATPGVFLGLRLEGPLARARLAYKESRLREAELTWQEVLLLDKTQAEALEGLAKLKREAYHSDADQPFDKAVKDLFEAAWRDLRKGRWVEARKKLKDAQALNPVQEDVQAALAYAAGAAHEQQEERDAKAFLARGKAYQAEGDDSQAAVAFSAALAADPQAPGAQAALNEIRARNSEKVAALVQTGQRALQEQRWEAAALNFEKASVLDPANGEAATGLAQAKASAGGQRDQAAQRAQADRLYNLGVEAWQAGRLADAASQFRACLVLDPADAEARRALDLLTQKLDERVEKSRQAALRLLSKGRTLEDRGAWDQALRHYERAAARDPGLAEAVEAKERLKGRMKGI